MIIILFNYFICNLFFLESAKLKTAPRTSVISNIVDKSVIKKKKLEFAGRKSVKEDVEKTDKNEYVNYESLDENQLTELLRIRREKLEVLRRHQKEKKQLIEYTARWKEVGNEALEILTEKYFKMSREQIIHKIGLDDYVFD